MPTRERNKIRGNKTKEGRKKASKHDVPFNTTSELPCMTMAQMNAHRSTETKHTTEKKKTGLKDTEKKKRSQATSGYAINN